MPTQRFVSWCRRILGQKQPGPHRKTSVRPRTLLFLETLERREVPATIGGLSLPTLPAGNYVDVAIANNTQTYTGGLTSQNLFVSMKTDKVGFQFTQYQNASGKTVYVATIDANPGASVPSIPLANLVDTIDNNLGFYIQVANSPFDTIKTESGRIYFANQQNALAYVNGIPQGIPPTSTITWDFVEFTVDAYNKLTLDTTQIDQVGMPINLQLNPVAHDFPNGTGIVTNQTLANLLQQFQQYTATGTSFTAYKDLVSATRLLGPQNYLQENQGDSTLPLQESFDQSLFNFYNYYYSGTNGGGHKLYIVGNGNYGPEIFEGQVITNFQAKDEDGNSGTYTVLQFTGTGYTYTGTNNTLSKVSFTDSSHSNYYYGGSTYQIFYPYFKDNTANSYNKTLSSTSKAPQWFSPSFGGNHANLSSAGQMALGASGVFADNAQQTTYYGSSAPANFDSKMLGNLENQIVTMVNRGVTPVTGNTTTPSNLQLRTVTNTSSDLIFLDYANLKVNPTPTPLSPTTNLGASISYTPADLLKAINAPSDGIYWNTLSGVISYQGKPLQLFTVNPGDLTKPFTLIPAPGAPSSPTNLVTKALFVFGTGGVVTNIEFDWQSAVGIPTDTKVSFAISHAPKTTEAHYAILNLISPYSPTLNPNSGTPFTDFKTGDLGPATNLSAGLIGATNPKDPTSGMALISVGLGKSPTYVYQTLAGNSNQIIIYSPVGISPINTNVTQFAKFFPTDSKGLPIGEWNAYDAFFHIGDPAHKVPPPTVDGRGYAFAYDDNGGYSSTITVTLPTTVDPAKPVVQTINLNILPFKGPYSLKYTTTAPNFNAGSVSGTITIGLVDAFGKAFTPAAPISIDLTTSSTAGSFLAVDGMTKITSITIPAGKPSASFKYTDTQSGSPVLTAKTNKAPRFTITQTAKVKPAAARRGFR